MRRAVELDPDRADAWLFLAETSYRAGDYEETSFAAFDRVCELAPESLAAQQAEVDRRLLSRNLRCVLMTRNIWSQEVAESFVSQEPAQHTTCLPRVWDDVLKPELLELLHRSVDDICTWRIKSPRSLSTFWLPRGKAPRTAAEVAGRLLLQLLGEDEKDYDGIEWWCRTQCARMGAHFHYDTAISETAYSWAASQAQLLRMLGPGWSSVLYLGSLGGPTMVLDQVMEMEKNHPAIPSRGWISSCSSNRWLAFGGDLRHGAVSFGLKEPEPHAPRNVILFNYWIPGLRPAPPSCAEPCFQELHVC
ncbi:Hypothetical protein (Fragment) [Durusdinium trenchii]|uniref:Tetratricopeptide repeat protein 38 n=1 Tax=Durusdinium trenchii TaxID=1381693 RepID=A0ABP0QNX6_9DINO